MTTSTSKPRESEPRLSPWAKSVTAGSVSGMASVVVCHPFDTIRTRLQISPQRFRGFFDCAAQTIERESAAALYKGFAAPFFTQAVYKSVIFTTSAKFRNDIFPNCQTLQPWLTPSVISLSSGAIAGGLNAFIVTPVELVRNRLQVQYKHVQSSRRYRGTFHCIAQVMRTEGIGAFWRGFSTTILRDSLGVACYFLGFDFAKQQLSQRTSIGDTSVLLTAGAFGGISFWAIALPFDTIKTLIQVDTKQGKHSGLLSTTGRLIQDHGVLHLLRGWQAAFSRGIPSAAITFYTFDRTSRYLNELDAN